MRQKLNTSPVVNRLRKCSSSMLFSCPTLLVKKEKVCGTGYTKFAHQCCVSLQHSDGSFVTNIFFDNVTRNKTLMLWNNVYLVVNFCLMHRGTVQCIAVGWLTT
jgi:hypothetical protein